MGDVAEGRERQFDGATFLVFARTLFLRFLQARSKWEMQPMRSHFSPQLYKAWQKLQAGRVERRRVARLSYEIQDAELISHYHAKEAEVAIAIISGVAAPKDIRYQAPARLLKERWTFVRPIALAGQPCPVCGSPWTLSALGKCRYCNRDFSGTTDGWLVVNVENLIVNQELFAEESAFLDRQNATVRKSQVTTERHL